MKHRSIGALLFLCMGFISVSANSAETPYNRLSFQVQHSLEVSQDELAVRLYSQHEHTRQAVAAERVNEAINAALLQLKQFPQIKVQTDSYRVSPVYKDSRIVRWRARQALRLKTTDFPAMSQVLANLQESLMLEHLNFQVSHALRESLEQRMSRELLEKAQATAQTMAKTLGAPKFVWVRIDVQGAGLPSVRKEYARGLMMADTAAIAAPELQAGQDRLQSSARIEIELLLPE